MNAISYIRAMEVVGAREFRKNLDNVLRHPEKPLRVMLHNKPTLAVMSDEAFMLIMEIFEELRDGGLLSKITKKIEQDSRKNNAWYWTKKWKNKISRAKKDVKKGHVFKANSANDMIRMLNS